MLTLMLGQLDAIGRNSSTTAVVLRMKLAALTTELIAADLIERARRVLLFFFFFLAFVDRDAHRTHSEVDLAKGRTPGLSRERTLPPQRRR